MGQKVSKVSATYTYYAPETMSIEEAKRIALERAKIDAIANEFGTIIHQNNSMVVSNSNGKTDETFNSYQYSDVKGEWIETINEPQYDIDYKDHLLIVTVRVTGKIKEKKITNKAIEVKVLRNGTEEKFEDSEFNNEDQLYLRFRSSNKGYLLIYLLDQKNAFRLLPYKRQDSTNYDVEENTNYLFFDKNSVSPEYRKIVDEYILQTSFPYEFNSLFILFSQYPILPPEDYQVKRELPREMNISSFHKWLGRMRAESSDIIVEEISLTIKK